MTLALELSSSSESSSNPPAIALVSPTSTEQLVVSPLSDRSGSNFLPFFAAKVKQQNLVMREDLDDSGRPRRRRCFIGNCRGDKKQTPNSQYLCDYTCCQAFVYTYGKKMYEGKYFCPTCFDKHRSESLKILMSSMPSI